MMITVEIYRYNPETDDVPQMRRYQIDGGFGKKMVLDVLEHLKAEDQTLSYRRSCREGVCGSDGMNINGINKLACITPVAEVIDRAQVLTLRPLPGMPVIRDLVVDLTQFFKQYERIHPYLINDGPPATIERLQSPEERARLDRSEERRVGKECRCRWWA